MLKSKNLFIPKCNERQILLLLDPQLQPWRGLGYHQTIQSLTSSKRYAQKASECSTENL